MKNINLLITPELPEHFEKVEQLAAQAFGPGRFTRTAFRLREGRAHEADLSFVAQKDGELVGAVRQTIIQIDGREALVLGPLVVLPEYKSKGIGQDLMETAVQAAKDGGHELIILVGDEPYYRAFGFKVIERGRITLPGPVDPMRFLGCELREGAIANYQGAARAVSKVVST